MPRKQPFPPEADTQPDIQRPSGPAPKNKRASTEAPTVPPAPKSKRGKGERSASKASDTRTSGIHSRKPSAKPRSPDTKRDGATGASVDEVTADLSKDPRRDRDE